MISYVYSATLSVTEIPLELKAIELYLTDPTGHILSFIQSESCIQCIILGFMFARVIIKHYRIVINIMKL